MTPQTTEGAVTAFGSGGGFSWHFDQPSYQSSAVESYFKNHASDLPSGIHYNKKGRATPDVAALGWGFSVVVNGNVESIGGTRHVLFRLKQLCLIFYSIVPLPPPLLPSSPC